MGKQNYEPLGEDNDLVGPLQNKPSQDMVRIVDD